MAAGGLIAIAFVVTKVGVWLNQSMQERNASFQGSRMAAANIQPGQGPVRFSGPSGIHLIGSTTGSTGGIGQQPDSTYDTSCTSGALAQAAAKRLAIFSILGVDVPDLQARVALLDLNAYQMIVWANQLASDAAKVADALHAIRDVIDPQLDALHNMPLVQHTMVNLPARYLNIACSVDPDLRVHGGLFNIDERLTAIACQLSSGNRGSVGWEYSKLRRIQTIDSRLASIARALDPARPGSTANRLAREEARCAGGAVLEDGISGPWDVSACFGHNLGPHASSPHKGTDFSVNLGTSVLAFKDGTVVVAENACSAQCGIIPLMNCTAACSHGYGNYVRIRHSDNTYTLYAHLDSVNVTSGQTVTGGEVLGASGTSGKSTGPHLHFEAQNASGTPIDPLEGQCCDTDGFGNCGIPPVVTMSDALGSATTGTCNPAAIALLQLAIANLETSRTNYQNERADILNELDPVTLADLPAVTALRNALRVEQSALRALQSQIRNLQNLKRGLLNDIDRMLNANHNGLNWMSLWRQLAEQHGLSDTLAPDLSNLYDFERAWRDQQNDRSLGEPHLPIVWVGQEPANLEELIRRLWWLIRQRLDLAQSEQNQTGFNPTVDDDFGEYGYYHPNGTLIPNDNPFTIPHAIECVGPGPCTDGGPARYPELVRLVQVLQDKAVEIRELIIDAEGLEQVGQAECASQEELNNALP